VPVCVLLKVLTITLVKSYICQQWVHCPTDCLGLGFGEFRMLASARALCLPTIRVRVFCTRLRVEVQGPIGSAVKWSLVLGVKSKGLVPIKR